MSPGREYYVQLLVLSLSFFFLLGAFMPAQSYLTSTRNEGYYALASIYFAFSISAGFADQVSIQFSFHDKSS
jgi:hypothetical protein